MKRINYYTIILVISLSANILFGIARIIENNAVSENVKQIINSFNIKEYIEFEVESIKINPNEQLVDINGETVFLNSIIEGSEKLILIISDYSCGLCVEKILKDLSLATSVISSNILVLGVFKNKREFFLQSIKYPYQFLLLADNSVLGEVAINSPIFFTLDNSYKISSVFLPMTTYPSLLETYFKHLAKRFQIRINGTSKLTE